jgi:hypothetical protein
LSGHRNSHLDKRSWDPGLNIDFNKEYSKNPVTQMHGHCTTRSVYVVFRIELPNMVVQVCVFTREKVAAGPGEGLSDVSIVNCLDAVRCGLHGFCTESGLGSSDRTDFKMVVPRAGDDL